MSGFYPADVGRTIVAGGGIGTITAYTDADTVTVTISAEFPGLSIDAGDWQILGSPMTTATPSAEGVAGDTITVTLTSGGWRPEDVGKFIRINGGLVQITVRTSATVVTALVIVPLESDVAAPALAWSLEGSMWGGVNGWPRCGTFYQQRLWLAGSPGYPMTLWGSCIKEYFDFTIGDLDTDALAIEISTGQMNPILNLASGKQLIALTSGGEHTIRGGQEKALTPTNLQVSDQSDFGCAPVRPVRIGGELFFVQRSGRKIRALSANQYDGDQYDAPDVTVLSEHITAPGVLAMAAQAEPQAILYAARGDGQLATLTADRDQPVFGWARQVTQGVVEDVACVPIAGGWAVYAIVARVIDGQPVRGIERFVPGLQTDSALRGTSEAGAATWGGLAHLEGMKAQVIADGIYLGEFEVEGGQVTLPREANTVEIGLAYTTTIKTLTPELSVPAGSLQGAQLSIHETKVRLRDTIGCTVNLQEVAFRKYDTLVLDRRPEEFSGDHKVGNLQWGDGTATTLVQQVLPYPLHVLSIVSKLTINEG
jgi:hypothetical protein